MALLQISEPGQSLEPHQRKRAVGIDLGTTNSLVAAVRNGVAEVLPDIKGQSILPSVVQYLKNEQTLVGLDAKLAATSDPVNTIVSVKRFMGRGADDLAAASCHAAYTISSENSVVPRIVTDFKKVTAVEVSAEILKVLKNRAEETLGGELAGAVITVPAYFDDAQRHATKEAATLAGLPVLRLLNEPTAAAIAYGLDKAAEGVIAVYDLGGGTFDISILQLRKGVFEVLATAGNTALGGDDFDGLIVQWLIEEMGLAMPLSKSMARQLMTVAASAKEYLSEHDSVSVEVALDNGKSWQGSLTRDFFESLIESLIRKTLSPCRRALADAKLTRSDVAEVIMVGGSTRVPLVRRRVTEFFGKEVLTDINPDEVVANGAAIQADILVGNKSADEMLLLDVIPLSLGLETMGGLVEKIIPRNSTLPIARAQNFTTFKDGQTSLAVHVVQGERELVNDCRSLARFELRGIPPMVAGAAKVEITFQVDADGLLSVTAHELTSRVEASIVVKPSFGLSDEEVATMLKNSVAHAKEDMRLRSLKEQQVEAARVIEALDAALATDGKDLLSDQEMADILKSRQALTLVKNDSDHENIKQAILALENVTRVYVERRMNSNISRAMSGHSINEYNK